MSQKGFTLVEILVVTAIGGMLMAGLATAIIQVYLGNIRNSGQVVILTELDHAVLWIKKDLAMVQNTDDLTEEDQIPVTLEWTDYTGWTTEEMRDHYVTYALSGTELLRTYDGTPYVIGRHITDIGFTQNGGAINVTITANSEGVSQQTETLEFSVQTRPEVQ